MVCGIPTNSVEGQRKLLRYVLANDLTSIERLIFRHTSLLSIEYNDPSYEKHNILTIACNNEAVTSATITKLIDLGADCTAPTTNYHWQAIHYAAINTNTKKLSAIIERLTVQEANSLVHCSKHVPKNYPFGPNKNVLKSYSNNALSILLKYGKRNEQFRECCELLIQKGVSVSQADSNGITPLDLMEAEKELSEVVRPQEVNKSKDIFELIKFNKEEEFLLKQFTQEEVNSIDGPTEILSSCTLLQMCCAKGLTACVKHILQRGAALNKIIPKNVNSPIMIAIKEDHVDIVHLLLQNHDLLLPEDILIKLQVQYKHMRNFARIDKYMEIVLKHLQKYEKTKLRKYLEATDELNRTAIHYATHYRCSENILELLAMGSPLTKKDIFGYTPLHSIEPSLLEKFLDNCVGIPKNDEDMDNMLYALRNKKQKFSVEINYEALTSGSQDHESEFLHQLIKVKGLTYLLNHPVVTTYLAVKWTKFRWGVYINLLLYLLSYFSLLFYGFGFTSYSMVSNALLLTSLVMLFIRENIQVMIFRVDYLTRVDNIIDLFLIGGVIYIIASGWIETLLNQNLRVAFSIVFLSSTLGIFLQLGNLPFFTVKVIVLRQISISFCKYMIFYVFPVLAFFFCFYMLRETSDDVFFETLYDVITMFAGDPNSGYPEQFVTNPIFSHIIYVCFILLIGIILQNLLIGLAVSDLQEIQKEAVFIDKKERANYITNIERVVFSKHRESSNFIFRTFFRKLLNVGGVFEDERVLVVQPYNYGCVYVKDKPDNIQYIKDQSIIDLLQNIFKDLTLSKDKDSDSPYSLKVMYDKLQRIESLLERLDVNQFLKK